MEAKKILIGVPSNRQDSKFLASLNNLIEQMQGKYEVALLIEKWKHLPDAQNRIVDYFLLHDFDYLLFLDDDHWGHTVEMVDCLVEANADMATIKTYVRHYPYPVALFKMNGRSYDSNKYVGIDHEHGYHKVDATGFPMTLLKSTLFNKLDKPYFRGVEFAGRTWNTDMDFCERLREIGIRPVGCYQYCLPHGDITQDNVVEMRIRNMSSMTQRVTAFFNLTKTNPIKGVS